ncbi:C-type lectin domain family 4 member M [Mizuhopecten yessoensis]|uniref:C-type lectin domain family 4 member M n=1 Tax=Mizuhopecten yessoensis TaxID=6573 RepID=A0A210PU73_MIZYE|nr:C-type lectin domain family 4 member M [Mizuhopecten yessoensis]
MFHSIFAFVFVVSFWRVLHGQQLPSDRRARLEAALLEQSILENIRPLVKQLCSSESSTDHRYSSHRSEVQSLTNRVDALEEWVLSQKIRQQKDNCTTRFKKIDPAPDVHVFEGVCYYVNSSRQTWNDSQTTCQLAGANLVTLASKQVQDFILGLMQNNSGK